VVAVGERRGGCAAALIPDPPDFAGQRGQVGRDDGPDDVVIDRGVAVDQAVPHSYDLEPRNPRETLPRSRRDLRGRLTHDFDESFEGRGENVVGIEVLTAPAGSLKRISSSGRFIKRNGLLNNPWPEVWAEEAGRHQIDPSTEKIRQLGLEGNESKTDGDPRLELDKDVEIALSPQRAPEC
jgi:hypothetical protein